MGELKVYIYIRDIYIGIQREREREMSWPAMRSIDRCCRGGECVGRSVCWRERCVSHVLLIMC